MPSVDFVLVWVDKHSVELIPAGAVLPIVVLL